MPAGFANSTKPSAWTKFTHALNVLVWHLPLPRRVKVRLSLFVYTNPPMPAGRTLETLDALHAAGIDVAVMGGWGVDALLGEQSRDHRDLDLTVDRDEIDSALSALRSLEYEEWYREESPPPLGEIEVLGDVVVVRDRAMRVVELHPIRFAAISSCAAHGSIEGRPVLCLSARQQVEAHTGYLNRSRRDRLSSAANLEAAKAALGPSSADRPD